MTESVRTGLIQAIAAGNLGLPAAHADMQAIAAELLVYREKGVAAELLAYRETARALVEAWDAYVKGHQGGMVLLDRSQIATAERALRALVQSNPLPRPGAQHSDLA